MSRVAILVAFHDDGETVQDTLASLRAEPDAEIVVVDDGSTDPASLDRLTELERWGVRLLRQENSGPSAAWMRGLDQTSAPYVMPFSSDDLLVPGAVGLLADALDDAPDAAAAWGDFESFGAASAYVSRAPALCPWHITYTNALPGIALFRRESLVAVGGWQLRTGIEDWDLWMRLAAEGHTGAYVPRPIFRYRRDAQGRFRGRVHAFAPFYEELRERNSGLFKDRAANRRTSPVPPILKVLIPAVDRMPLPSRLLKVQLCELLTLLFWNDGLLRTGRVLLQGVAFRARLLRAKR